MLLASLPDLWVEGGWLTLVSVVVALLFGLGDDLLRGTLVGKRLTCLVRWCAIVNNEREVFLFFGCWNLVIPPVGRWLWGVISSLKGEFRTVVLGCVVVCKKGLTIELIGWVFFWLVCMLGMKVIPTHLKKAEMILPDCRAKRDWG